MSIQSSDNTINVVYSAGTDTYDLTIDNASVCCEAEDKLVAVGPECTPDYLQNLVIKEPGSPIIINKVNCQLRIGLDEAALQDLDQKVAVDATCTPDFLDQLVTPFEATTEATGSGVVIAKQDCQLDWRINKGWDEWKKPRARMILPLTQEFTTAPSTAQITGFTNRSGHPDFHNVMFATADVMTIPKTGPYFISFRGNVEVSDYVHAFRIVLATDAAGLDGIVDHKYSGGYENGTIGGTLGGKTKPLSDMVYGVGQSVSAFFEEGDRVIAFIKISEPPHPSYSESDDVLVRVVGSNGTNVTPGLEGGVVGFSMSFMYVGDLLSDGRTRADTVYTP